MSPIKSKKNHNSYKNQKPFFKDRKLLENVTVDKEEVIITESKFVGPTSTKGVRVGYNLDKKILNLLTSGGNSKLDLPKILFAFFVKKSSLLL